ncbi:MAG: alpha/beta fold hydrolase [Burkholderiales bacterium]
MLRSKTIHSLLAVAAISGTVFAPMLAAREYSTPLGSALEAYPYPYPVRFLPLEIEGEPVRMAYMDVAESSGNGRSVVLLHGKNFYGSYWESTIKALTAAGYRVIVPDQIGFGKSSKPDIAYSFDLLAVNTARLLDHLNIKQAAIVGHSMGGMLAVRFARTYPRMTTHLVLENPIGLEDYRFKVPPRTTEEIYQQELNGGDPEKIREFVKRYVVEWKPEIYERFVEVRSRIALSGEYPRWAKASALTYQMIYQQPVRHEFALIKTPTLLAIGQEDRTTLGRGQVVPEVLKTLGQYPQLGRAAAKDIPGAKLVELDNVGHIPHLESPGRFHRALLDFLGS